MKRLSLILLVFVLTFCVNYANGMAATIEGMILWGGNGDQEGTWSSNGQIWDTFNNSYWVIGVSAEPGGVLLNQSDTTITGLLGRDYWLYAEPTNLGSNPKLEVFLSDGSVIRAIFRISGSPSIANNWERTFGDEKLSLGWAQGTADKVGSDQSMNPSGQNDFYLRAGILESVPTLTLTLIGCCTYRIGDRFTVEAHVTNPGPSDTLVEAKIGVRLPDGTQVNLVGDEHLVVSIPAGLDTTFTLFDMTLPSEIPTGTWKFEGTLLGPKLGEMFSREVKPFEVIP